MVTHAPLLQQPAAQEAASQTQLLVLVFALKWWPCRAAPRWRCVQVAFAEAWHCLLASQQPFGQDVASHTQLLPLQRWPLEQAAHWTPDAPQAVPASVVTHALLLQQPVAHVVASQTHCPPLHSSPVPQLLQAAPAVPQVPFADVWHWLLASQQPFGQEVASHTQLPWALHSWLLPQAAQVPPPTPHVWLVELTH